MTGANFEVSSEQLLAHVNKTTRTLGGHYSEYSTKRVSYDDVKRYEIQKNGKKHVSVLGPNITDSTLAKSDGKPIYVTRPDNHLERIGKVSTDQVALLHKENGEECLTTLTDYLKHIGKEGQYRHMDPNVNLYAKDTDRLASVRFQCCFIPVDSTASPEFHAQVYSYRSTNSNPQNLMIVSSSQGSFMQYPGSGTTGMYAHLMHSDGSYHKHNFVADTTSHKVGGGQVETLEEIAKNEKENKASATRIGLECLGPRFNVVMTIQVPLQFEQDEAPPYPAYGYSFSQATYIPEFALPSALLDDEDGSDVVCYKSLSALPFDSGPQYRGTASYGIEQLPIGVSSAARVSIGSDVGKLGDFVQKSPVRNPNEHITLTIIIYYTVQGGIPSEHEIRAAIDDMENLYESCPWNGNINGNDDYYDLGAMQVDGGGGTFSATGASFMKTPLVSSSPVHSKVRTGEEFPKPK